MLNIKEIILTFVSIIYVTFIAQIAIYPMVTRLWSILETEAKAEKIEEKVKPRLWQGKVLGVIERILFLLSLLLGHVEFIGLWFGLKTVSQYKRWSENEVGRATFNIFLIANGFSLLYALAGYGFIVVGEKMRIEKTSSIIEIISPFLILLAPIILSVTIFKFLEKDVKIAEKNLENSRTKNMGNKNGRKK